MPERWVFENYGEFAEKIAPGLQADLAGERWLVLRGDLYGQRPMVDARSKTLWLRGGWTD